MAEAGSSSGPKGVIQATEGGRFKVLFSHRRWQYEVQGLFSAEEAGLVCDVLSIKEALDDQVDVATSKLHIQQQLQADDGRFEEISGSELSSTGFTRLVQQLQACVEIRLLKEVKLAADSFTLLHTAACLGHTPLIQLLLLANPTPAMRADRFKHTPLHAAAAAGQSIAVQVLLVVAPAAATGANALGNLPLHLAAQRGHTAVCELLLQAATDLATAVAAANGAGNLALHLAARNGHKAVCEQLLQAAPNVATAVAGNSGWRPLHYAACYGRTEVAALLLARAPGMAIASNALGNLPLHLAAFGGHTAMCEMLLQAAPATVAAGNGVGNLPLHLAAHDGHTAVCQLLVQAAPAAVTTAGRLGRLPLHYAALSGHTEVAALLLTRAPGIALMFDAEGNLPLHLAVVRHHATVCEVLLEAAPAAALISDAQGILPLQLALGFGQQPQHLDAARCLLAASPAFTVLSLLSAAGAPALPLFADFVIARPPLSGEEWALVPAPCPGLGRALPAALAHSPEQARQLVLHLPPPDVQRLRTSALALHRFQTCHDLSIPTSIVSRILALSCVQ